MIAGGHEITQPKSRGARACVSCLSKQSDVRGCPLLMTRLHRHMCIPTPWDVRFNLEEDADGDGGEEEDSAD